MALVANVYNQPDGSVNQNQAVVPAGGATLVTTSGTQTLTNKTLTAPTLTAPVITGAMTVADGATLTTPIVTINDNELSIVDQGDATKVLQFQCSGITTATTRTWTVPDSNDTIVGLAATQTLTNKTLTSPVLGGSATGTYTLAGTPTITSPAISAPVITGAATVADGATLTTPIITSIKDTAGVVRQMHNATAKTIVDGSATSLFSVALTAGQVIGGVMHFMVHASDATDHQVIAGIATYSAENKAGTTVGVMTYDAANEAKSVSSGTLTLAFTDTDDTNVCTFKLQPTGSLTESTYTITYSVFPLRGAVTIL